MSSKESPSAFTAGRFTLTIASEMMTPKWPPQNLSSLPERQVLKINMIKIK